MTCKNYFLYPVYYTMPTDGPTNRHTDEYMGHRTGGRGLSRVMPKYASVVREDVMKDAYFQRRPYSRNPNRLYRANLYHLGDDNRHPGRVRPHGIRHRIDGRQGRRSSPRQIRSRSRRKGKGIIMYRQRFRSGTRQVPVYLSPIVKRRKRGPYPIYDEIF
jgi:hypothetical protein